MYIGITFGGGVVVVFMSGAHEQSIQTIWAWIYKEHVNMCLAFRFSHVVLKVQHYAK